MVPTYFLISYLIPQHKVNHPLESPNHLSLQIINAHSQTQFLNPFFSRSHICKRTTQPIRNMKYTAITLTALSASTVQAVAIAQPNAAADPWCLFRGEGCWKAKRDAAPAAAPAPAAAADPWCLFRGEGCWKRDASPEADALPWCLFRGEGCWKEKREALAAPEPEPEPEADAEADPWCLFRGEGCWKEKREAAPTAAADPEAWCLFRGEGCWKVKRAAYAFANAIRAAGAIQESRAAEVSNMNGGAAYNAKRAIEDIGTALAGRTDSPAEFFKKLAILKHFHADANLTTIVPTHHHSHNNYNITRRSEVDLLAEREETDNTRRWCLFRGEGCWKRDAAPWCLFRGEGCWKRSVPMEAREAAADPWCLFRGEGCWKRTDGSSSSALEARDVSAAPAFCPLGGAAANTCYASRRDFIAADKRACNQPGEACDVARRAAEALVTEIESWQPTKRDAAADVEARWCLFRGEGCWKRDRMDEVVARCEAEGGACHQARRDLGVVHTAARNLLEYLSEE